MWPRPVDYGLNVRSGGHLSRWRRKRSGKEKVKVRRVGAGQECKDLEKNWGPLCLLWSKFKFKVEVREFKTSWVKGREKSRERGRNLWKEDRWTRKEWLAEKESLCEWRIYKREKSRERKREGQNQIRQVIASHPTVNLTKAGILKSTQYGKVEKKSWRKEQQPDFVVVKRVREEAMTRESSSRGRGPGGSL